MGKFIYMTRLSGSADLCVKYSYKTIKRQVSRWMLGFSCLLCCSISFAEAAVPVHGAPRPAVRGAEDKAPDLVKYVNTLQGTNSEFKFTHGNTYPATTLPWGMHTWTPQTGINGDGWKYQYAADSIRGFQQAH